MAPDNGFGTIRTDKWFDGRVRTITLDLPKGNVLTSTMIGEITTAIEQVDADDGCRALLIRAAGRHFSFGASVDEHTADKVGDMLPAFHRLIGALVHLDVTSIALVQGQCLGGAFELVLGCDIIFATKSARMGVPEITLGVFPPPASILLPAKIGPAAAQEMITTGVSFDGPRLHALGLVSQVVEDEKAEIAVRAFLEKNILPRSASTLRLANRAAKRSLHRLYDENIGPIERLYLDELMDTHDAGEGIGAFLEKRAPGWES